jgi:hypothetical protein
MSEPYRKYTKRQKLSAVMAAEMGGITVAAKQLHLPQSTLRDWLKHPKYAEFRAKTREDLAEEVKVAAHLLWKRVIETAGTMEPRDAIFGAEKAATILQLLTGQATDRLETRDVTGDLPDDELEAVTTAIAEWLKMRRTEDVSQ